MPDNTNFDICTIHNIDTEDFVFEYDRSSGNYPYTIPAGEVRRFPRFLAAHALKHLIDKILTKRHAKINNEEARKDLASQIVIEEEKFQNQPKKSEAEMVHEQVEELNRPSELDAILAKRKTTPEAPPIVPGVALVEDEKFEGLEPSPDDVGNEVDTTDADVPPAKEEVRAMPTRGEIYAYAQTTLKMVMDEPDKEGKTLRQRMDKMNVDTLLSEIGDPRT